MRRPSCRVDGLSVSYGHINALKGASLEVFPGEIVVLIGANGAGKTTLLETVLGINALTTGQHHVRRGVHRRGERGPQRARGAVPRAGRAGSFCLDERPGQPSSRRASQHAQRGAEPPPGLRLVSRSSRSGRDQIARTLSGGERQMLAIGRALMSAPKLIMVDEPSIGLAPIVVNDIFSILTRLNRRGTRSSFRSRTPTRR